MVHGPMNIKLSWSLYTDDALLHCIPTSFEVFDVYRKYDQ